MTETELCSGSDTIKKPSLEYVIADLEDSNANSNKILGSKSLPLEFPLRKGDKKDIKALLSKFNSDENIEALAAPQFGILKRIIVFEMKKKAGYNEKFPLSVWINPSYAKVNDKKATDVELCYSVKGKVGPVKRYRRVYYRAFNTKGKLIEGEAKGYMARVIQHKIDHLDGKLFIDSVLEGRLTSLREWLFAHNQLGENDNDVDLISRW